MKDWRYWWTMPVLLFAGPVGIGVDPASTETMPGSVAGLVTAVLVVCWVVLAIATVIGALWAYDRGRELVDDFRGGAR